MFGYENENRRGPGRWIQYIFETALIIAASGYLIRLGVRFFLEVWWVLLIIFLVVCGAVIGWRFWKSRHDTKW